MRIRNMEGPDQAVTKLPLARAADVHVVQLVRDAMVGRQVPPNIMVCLPISPRERTENSVVNGVRMTEGPHCLYLRRSIAGSTVC